jgi:hypothetical protein
VVPDVPSLRGGVGAWTGPARRRKTSEGPTGPSVTLASSRLRGNRYLFLGYFFVAVFFVVAAFLPAFSFTSWWLMRVLQMLKYAPDPQVAGLWRAFYAGEVDAAASIRRSACPAA